MMRRPRRLKNRRKKMTNRVIDTNEKGEVNLSHVLECLIRIDERQQKILDEISKLKAYDDELRKKVYGNGNCGLTDEITAIKTTLKNVKYGITLGFTILGAIIAVTNFFL